MLTDVVRKVLQPTRSATAVSVESISCVMTDTLVFARDRREMTV